MVDYARQWGTGENITLVIVFFKPAMEALCATEISRLKKEYSKSKKEDAVCAHGVSLKRYFYLVNVFF